MLSGRNVGRSRKFPCTKDVDYAVSELVLTGWALVSMDQRALLLKYLT